jgi:1-aminocyclopropane-1-carboxylate deaminase
MLYAVNDLVLKDYFAPGSNILAIHTGGLLGILGMSEKFFK